MNWLSLGPKIMPSSVRPSIRASVNMKVGTRTDSRSSSRDLNLTASFALGPSAAKLSASMPIFTPDLSVATAVTKLRRPRHSKISGSRTVAPKARPSAVSPWPRSNPMNSKCFMIAPKRFRAAKDYHPHAGGPARPFPLSAPHPCRAIRRKIPMSYWNKSQQ